VRQALTLYARTYCHLCDEMIGRLTPLQDELPFDVEVVDIDHHPELEDRFGEWVPVLMAGEREICHYHLDEAGLRAYLAEKR
jgi:thioredoxin reductase (NADPH)